LSLVWSWSCDLFGQIGRLLGFLSCLLRLRWKEASMAGGAAVSKNKAAPCVSLEALSSPAGHGGGELGRCFSVALSHLADRGGEGWGEARDLSALGFGCADLLILLLPTDRGGVG
jgi:hypothetical protein